MSESSPAAGRFLLDTNIVIALLAGDDAVLFHLDQSSEVFVPTAVLGELFFGAAPPGRPAENIAAVERFASGRSVIGCDFEVAREYGRLKQEFRAKGRPIPENDLWIAAMAKRHEMILVSRDAHFQAVDGLQVVDWAARST